MEERSADPILQRRQHGQGATNAKRQMIKVASTFGNRQYTFCTASGKGADHAQGKIMGKMHRIGLASSLPPATQRHSSPEGAPMCGEGPGYHTREPNASPLQRRVAGRGEAEKERKKERKKIQADMYSITRGLCGSLVQAARKI